VTSIEETLLGGNQLKKDSKRLIWKESNETQKQERLSISETINNLEKIVLYPMQIRSFTLSIKQNV